MIGLGLGILWVGYTAFAIGRVNAKGIQVSFSDMVMPKNRNNGVIAVKAAALGLEQKQLSNLGSGTTAVLARPGGGGI